jgi:hypothetical protein
LIEKNTLCVAMEFSRCVRAQRPRENRPTGRSLKTQQRFSRRGRHNSRRPGCSDESLKQCNSSTSQEPPE